MTNNRHYFKRGFTIVELIIVISIIGILATITVVAYNGIQDNARKATVMSDLDSATSILELSLKQNGSYPATKDVADNGNPLPASKGTTYQYTVNTSTTSPSYCITATNGTSSYMVSSSQTSPVSGGCPGDGTGGIAAITNLATDPRGISFTGTAGQPGWRTGRWAGSAPATATYSLITGAVDGPLSITTYARKTWTVAPAAMGNTGDTGYNNVTGNMAVTAGDIYTISCYMRPSVARNFYVGIYQYSSPGVAFTTARLAGATTAGPAGQWTRVRYTYTVPTGVTLIGIVCDSNSNTANGATNWLVGSTLDGTALMITSGSTLYTYGDGGVSSWIWNGTPNNSTSTGPAS